MPFHDTLSWLVLCVLLLSHVRVSLFLLYFHWSCGQPTLRPACSLVENAMSLTLWDLEVWKQEMETLPLGSSVP